MMFVSITRLRLRSFRFLLPFMFRASAIGRQAKNSAGCRGVVTRKTRGLAFWTITLWDDEKTMYAFFMNSPHREAMPKLAHWCDEACVGHWLQESAAVPAWDDAMRKMLEVGRLPRVSHPSAAQRGGIKNVS